MKTFPGISLAAAMLLLFAVQKPLPLRAEAPGNTAVETPGHAAGTLIREPETIDDRLVIRAFSDSLSQPSGFPVVVNNTVIFRLHGGIGPLDAEERARKTADMLSALFSSRQPIDSLRIVEGEKVTAIMGPAGIVSAFTDEDAAAEDIPRRVLAGKALERVQYLAEQYRTQTSGKNILFGVLKSIALLFMLAVFWHYLNKFFTLADGWTQKIRLHHKTESRHKFLQLLSPDHIASGLGWFIRSLELFLKILLLYAMLTTVLSFFPWTEHISTNLLAFVLKPAQTVAGELVTLLPTIITITILVAIVYFIGKLSDTIFRNISKGELKLGGFDVEWAEPTRKIVKITLYVILLFLFVASLPLADDRTTLALAVILCLTLSIGAIPLFQNVFSGIMLNYTGSFRTGDRIKIGEMTGDIIHKGPFVIRLKNLLNEVILVPNTTAFRYRTINYTESVHKFGHLSLELVFHLEENIRTETLRKPVIDAALETDGILLDPKPSLMRTETKNGLFGYILRAHTHEAKNLEQVYSRLLQNVLNMLNEQQYTVR